MGGTNSRLVTVLIGHLPPFWFRPNAPQGQADCWQIIGSLPSQEFWVGHIIAQKRDKSKQNLAVSMEKKPRKSGEVLWGLDKTAAQARARISRACRM